MSDVRRAADDRRTEYPEGIPFIVANEACERFSFYGMRAILFVYLVALFRRAGATAELADETATGVFHAFVASAYALPMIGAAIADRWLGKYRTILALSLVYCAGHACLAIFDGELRGTLAGLVLIAIGAGGIKPCVSAHVGDQFGAGNRFRLERIYQVFYFTINSGAFVASIAIPRVKEAAGFAWAFALPGVLMGLATFFFFVGRRRFVHVPPSPGGRFGFVDAIVSALLFLAVLAPMFGGDLVPAYADVPVAAKLALSVVLVVLALLVFRARQAASSDAGALAVTFRALAGVLDHRATYDAAERRLGGFWAPAVRAYGADAVVGPIAAYRMVVVVAMTSVFWSLFDQQGSTWVAQARDLDRVIRIGSMRVEILPEQTTAANPILVLVLLPLFAYVLYPAIPRLLGVSFGPLRRMGTGLLLAASSFVVLALVQQRLDAGGHVSVLVQLLAATLLTAGEVMVSVTGLELGYTAAPTSMKSTISGLFLLGISVGNMIVTFASHHVHVGPAAWFWGFAGLMAVCALGFVAFARVTSLGDRPAAI